MRKTLQDSLLALMAASPVSRTGDLAARHFGIRNTNTVSRVCHALKALCAKGKIQHISQGKYQLAENGPITSPQISTLQPPLGP